MLVIAIILILTTSRVVVIFQHRSNVVKVFKVFGWGQFTIINATNCSAAESNETNDYSYDNKQEFHFDFVIAPIK